jgi:hypothetical protein
MVCHVDHGPDVSTTPYFLSVGYFPQAFCGMGDGSGLGVSYIDNLTLATVMVFAWNLEAFTITTVGTLSNGTSSVSAANSLAFSAAGATATAYDRGGATGMWTPNVAVNTVWASWPASRIPKERACAPALVSGLLGNIFAIQGNNSGSPTENFFSLFFYVGPDPINVNKYRLYHGFTFTFTGRTSPANHVQISFSDQIVGGEVSSGSITIGGISFTWYGRTSGTGVPVVGTTPSMSASSSDYTYI